MAAKRTMRGPKGTRDLYPLEAARRRWLTELWRSASLRHGFEEVDGPTFETTDLYAVKSGEGILGELFQAFSGKDEKQVEAIRAGGSAPFALRPEFTPTLARMYAARASSLGKPTKWFSVGPFFRAERPQRGRLREFLQWNVDVLGLDIPEERWVAGQNVGSGENAEARSEDAEVAEAKARMDAECIGVCIGMLEAAGLGPGDCEVRYNDRQLAARLIAESLEGEASEDRVQGALQFLDKRPKLSAEAANEQAGEIGLSLDRFDALVREAADEGTASSASSGLAALREASASSAFSDWLRFDPTIVRGLAYYTGTVFEVIAEGERAVAGGGRYDNLVELFGGPPTPAVGFAMGDVVISLLLQDKGLMPSDEELMEAAGARPDAFIISAHPDLDGRMHGLLAALRRAGLHARRSYRSTRNRGKLLKEAGGQRARVAVVIESEGEATIKPLDGGAGELVPLGEVVERVGAAAGRS